MSQFSEIANQYATIDAFLGRAVQDAFDKDDDAAFDLANKARERNDHAYFLFLFTRFEAEVNQAVETLLTAQTDASIGWSDRRVWQAWSRHGLDRMELLSKVEVLIDKSRAQYAEVKKYYGGRNEIAHGREWDVQFFIPDVAQTLEQLVGQFAAT